MLLCGCCYLRTGKKTAESEPENPRTVIIVYVKYRSLGSLVVVNSIKNISPIQIYSVISSIPVVAFCFGKVAAKKETALYEKMLYDNMLYKKLLRKKLSEKKAV